MLEAHSSAQQLIRNSAASVSAERVASAQSVSVRAAQERGFTMDSLLGKIRARSSAIATPSAAMIQSKCVFRCVSVRWLPLTSTWL